MPVASSEDQVLISRASVDAVVRNLKSVGFRLVERSAYIDHTLTGLKVVSFLLAEGVPFVPKDWQRGPEDEIVDAFEFLESQDEAEQHELREGKRCGKDTCKGRSKGRPRDMASRSRSGDRRGQRQGGTCGSSLCPSHKGKNKGRSKGKDAPLSKTPCHSKGSRKGEYVGKYTGQGRSKGKPRFILEKVYDAAGHELCPDIQEREGWERRFDSRGRTLSLQYCTRVRGDDENDERRIMHWAYPSSDEEEGVAFYRSKVTEPHKR